MLEQSVTAIPARREVLQGSMAQRVRVVQAVRLRRAPRSPAAFSFRSDLVLNDIKLELSALTHAHARALTCVPPPISLSISHSAPEAGIYARDNNNIKHSYGQALECSAHKHCSAP